MKETYFLLLLQSESNVDQVKYIGMDKTKQQQ